MHKTLTIIKREFLVRLRSRGFIVATILGPLALIILMATPVLLFLFTDGDDEKTVVVLDETQAVFDLLSVDEGLHLSLTDLPLDSLKQQISGGDLDGLLVLPSELLDGSGKAFYYSRGGSGLTFRYSLESAVNRAVRNHRLILSGAPDTVLDIIGEQVDMEMQRVTTGGGAQRDDTGVMSIFGYVMGCVIYLAIFIYGSLVMRGVIEEKTSRIMEVVVSSSKRTSNV